MKGYDHFPATELRCPCGQCDGGRMNEEFMQKLVFIRELTGIPMALNSGYRCPAHNAAMSHTGTTGPHTTGRAVDVRISRKDAYKVLKIAMQAGMTGVGIQQKGEGRFIHFDDLLGEDWPTRPWVWSY